eukprot:287744-Chlamydomonas_euryale.AAC.1
MLWALGTLEVDPPEEWTAAMLDANAMAMEAAMGGMEEAAEAQRGGLGGGVGAGWREDAMRGVEVPGVELRDGSGSGAPHDLVDDQVDAAGAADAGASEVGGAGGASAQPTANSPTTDARWGLLLEHTVWGLAKCRVDAPGKRWTAAMLRASAAAMPHMRQVWTTCGETSVNPYKVSPSLQPIYTPLAHKCPTVRTHGATPLFPDIQPSNCEREKRNQKEASP